MEKFEDFIKHVEVNLLPGCRGIGAGSRHKAPWAISSVEGSAGYTLACDFGIHQFDSFLFVAHTCVILCACLKCTRGGSSSKQILVDHMAVQRPSNYLLLVNVPIQWSLSLFYGLKPES